MNKIKKIIILTIPVLLLCGCNRSDYNEKHINDNPYNELYVTYDNDTCVEYIEYSGVYKGGLSVRFNTDGTIKLNKNCLAEKVSDSNE